MADILNDFPVRAPVERVFHAISTPEGLNTWWTKACSGVPAVGAEYALEFGPSFDWAAMVTACVPNSAFEVEMVRADTDWAGTRVGINLEPRDGVTWVRFHHTGWPSANEHYRISSHCWAMYLRILRRSLEHGESVPYDDRLDV